MIGRGTIIFNNDNVLARNCLLLQYIIFNVNINVSGKSKLSSLSGLGLFKKLMEVVTSTKRIGM